MRDEREKRKLSGRITVLAILFSMLLGLLAPGGLKASESVSGSISVTLTVSSGNSQMAMSGIPLALYKVGEVDEDGIFAVVSSLSGTGVDLNNLSTAGEARNAADTLAAAVSSSGLAAVTQTTDQSGTAVFSSLASGVYLLVQTGGTDTCQMLSDLLYLPHTNDDGTKTYDITALPKAISTTAQRDLTVTKKLTLLNGFEGTSDLYAISSTYYVRLYLDEAATIPYGEAQAINIVGNNSGTVTFSNMPTGTYYLRETDENGNPRSLTASFTDQTGKEASCLISVEGSDTTQVTFETDFTGTHEVLVENNYLELPDGFYYAGQINITKKTLKNGEAYNTDKTFYAAVFEDSAYTSRIGDVIVLDMAGGSEVSAQVEVPIGTEADSKITYYVTETDKDGNPVENGADLEYVVSVDSTEVTLTGSNTIGNVTITNTLAEATPTPTETPTETPTPTPEEEVTEEETSVVTQETTADSHGDSTGTDNVKTGDDTPIAQTVVILVLAAIVAAAAIIIRRRKK